jgi:hypothetical protein
MGCEFTSRRSHTPHEGRVDLSISIRSPTRPLCGKSTGQVLCRPCLPDNPRHAVSARVGRPFALAELLQMTTGSTGIRSRLLYLRNGLGSEFHG